MKLKLTPKRETVDKVLHTIAAVLLWLMLLPLRTAQFLRRHKEWVLTGMGMLAVLLVSAAITLRIALHVREVTVPDFTGKTLQEASQGALERGVGLVIENKFYSTTVPAGRVLTQYPKPDTIVRHGWKVRVAESLGPQQGNIPDVAGEDLRDAAIDIRRNQLDLGTLSHIDAPGDQDMVLAQTPPPNAGMDQPRVNLLLSNVAPLAASAIALPSFTGLSSSAAIRAAAALGLVISGAGNGPVVTSQSPGAGTRVVRGDSVRISLGGSASAASTLSSIPQPTTIKLP